ncbi:hypothetical protein [Vibrio splendidus]|uniref:Uncharacterized protein n=1 Tax=Vibrio splendidus TaxID=29497 RepID=A0A2T5DWN7_VIBSP|nr:hypothetical protein [Vibrio splendidus]OEE70695.1 hypothetical protein A147_01490 [Vibrio splendidus FF-6]PTP11467.1 hypothetical protein CWO36_24670 [Vibrio splendidus]
MNSSSEISINGLCSKNTTGGICKFQSVVKVTELFELLPDHHVLFDTISSTFDRPTNKKRVSQLTEYLGQSIERNSPTDVLRVTLFFNGQVKERDLGEHLKRISFEKDKALLLDGFNLISAIAKLKGMDNPFTKKTITNQRKLTALQNIFLCEMDVQLNVMYPISDRISDSDIYKLFIDINTNDTRVYSQNLLVNKESNSPLASGCHQLEVNLNLERLGGVSKINKLTKSDTYITTQNTLIYIILGSLGGKGLRIDKYLPTHLPDKQAINTTLVNSVISEITQFMGGWLSGLQKDFKQNKNGFHQSMQIWQALGLVIYHLKLNQNLSLEGYYIAGHKLAQLDYQKNAPHWGNCKAFKMDSTNSFWINATGGGRTFRDEVAIYFINVIEHG